MNDFTFLNDTTTHLLISQACNGELKGFKQLSQSERKIFKNAIEELVNQKKCVPINKNIINKISQPNSYQRNFFQSIIKGIVKRIFSGYIDASSLSKFIHHNTDKINQSIAQIMASSKQQKKVEDNANLYAKKLDEKIASEKAEEPKIVLKENCNAEPCRRWVEKASSVDAAIPEDTKKAYKTKDGKYTFSRSSVHAQIKKEIIGNAKPVAMNEKPLAIIMMGAPGAGKSMCIQNITKNSDQFVEVGVDNVMERIPEYKKAINLGFDRDGKIISAKNACEIARNEATEITVALREEVIDSRRNLVYDGTGQNYSLYKYLIEKLKNKGYKVKIYYIDVDLEQSKSRVKNRAQNTGRLIPDHVIESIYKNAKKNFQSIALLGHKAVIMDNRLLPGRRVSKFVNGALVEGGDYLAQKGFQKAFV